MKNQIDCYVVAATSEDRLSGRRLLPSTNEEESRSGSKLPILAIGPLPQPPVKVLDGLLTPPMPDQIGHQGKDQLAMTLQINKRSSNPFTRAATAFIRPVEEAAMHFCRNRWQSASQEGVERTTSRAAGK